MKDLNKYRRIYNNFSLSTKVVVKNTFTNLSINDRILIMHDAKNKKYIHK